MLPFCPLMSPPEPPVPIRLWLPVTVRAMMSLAADEGPVLPATIVSVSVAVTGCPPRRLAVAADGAVGERRRANVFHPAAGVSADGAVGERRRAKVVHPAAVLAELPLIVQLVSVAVPETLFTPPPNSAEFPLMVQLVSVTVPSLYTPPPEVLSRR